MAPGENCFCGLELVQWHESTKHCLLPEQYYFSPTANNPEMKLRDPLHRALNGQEQIHPLLGCVCGPKMLIRPICHLLQWPEMAYFQHPI